jgi:hypothetical protein
MQDESIPLIYDSNAIHSNLPITRAIAIVITNPYGLVMMLKRSEKVDEFKGAWSFPSTFIPSDIDDGQSISYLLKRIYSWMDINIENPHQIARRMGLRPKWRLLMFLYMGFSTTISPTLHSDKYDSYQWVDGGNFLGQYEYSQLGECAKSYLDFVHNKSQ